MNFVLLSELTINPVYRKLVPVNQEDFQRILASVKEEGIREPIIVNQDFVVLDGHTRYAAAEAAGIEEVPFMVREFNSDWEERRYARMANLQRRQLTKPQVGMLVVDQAKDYDGRQGGDRGVNQHGSWESAKSPNSDSCLNGKSQDQVAPGGHLNGKSVELAIKELDAPIGKGVAYDVKYVEDLAESDDEDLVTVTAKEVVKQWGDGKLKSTSGGRKRVEGAKFLADVANDEARPEVERQLAQDLAVEVQGAVQYDVPNPTSRTSRTPGLPPLASLTNVKDEFEARLPKRVQAAEARIESKDPVEVANANLAMANDGNHDAIDVIIDALDSIESNDSFKYYVELFLSRAIDPFVDDVDVFNHLNVDLPQSIYLTKVVNFMKAEEVLITIKGKEVELSDLLIDLLMIARTKVQARNDALLIGTDLYSRLVQLAATRGLKSGLIEL